MIFSLVSRKNEDGSLLDQHDQEHLRSDERQGRLDLVKLF